MTITRFEHQGKPISKNVQTGTLKTGPFADQTAKQTILWDDTVSFGENLPDWRAAIKEGRNATTSMTGFRYGAHLSYGRVGNVVNDLNQSYRRHDGQLMVNNGVATIPGACAAATVNRATTEAAIKFVKHYRQKTTNWGGAGEFLGTIVQTARLIRDPVMSLRKGVDGLYADLIKALNRAGGVGIPKALLKRRRREAIADTWLVWSFGVKPTIQDINDACTAARAIASGRQFDLVRLNGEAEFWDTISVGHGITYNASPSGSIGAAFSKEIIDHAWVRYRGAWKNTNPGGELLPTARFGLSLQEIVPTAWELVPWSFFVDYFTNVGNVLDACNVSMVNFAWMNRSTRSSRSVRYSDVYRQSPPASNETSFYGQGGHARCVRRDVLRESTASLADARFSLNMKMPSTLRQLNIAALIQMRERRILYGRHPTT